MTDRNTNPGALNAVTAAIKKATRRGKGKFDGVFGSLPDDAAVVLRDIVVYLRQYLLDERRLSKKALRKLAAESLPMNGYRSVSQRAEDDGVRVALSVLNTVCSVMEVGDFQQKLDGQPLSKSEAIMLLLSGRTGVQRHRHMERQRTNAKKGSQARTEGRRNREARWLAVARPLREKHPDWSDSTLARNVTLSKGVSVSASTIRQALPRHGLSKKAAR